MGNRKKRGHARKLTAFLDLSLQMAFLIEKILETEVGLVHVVSGVGSNLFVGASGSIGIAIEGLETGEEGACADVYRGWVVIWGGGGAVVVGGGELAEGEDDLL
jgi:hypothetical protein